MNDIDQTTLTRKLMEGGFIPSDATPSEPAQLARPWFIGLLLGASGWLAGIFLVIFVGMLFTPDSAGGWFVASAIAFAAAFGLYAVDKESAFFDQLALALWFAGQAAFWAAMSDTTNKEFVIAAATTVLQCILALFTPNRFARLIASFFACIAWGFTCRFAVAGDLNLWGGSRKGVALAPMLGAAFASWLPLIVFLRVLIARETAWLAGGKQHLVRPVLAGVLLGLAFGPLVTNPEVLIPMWTDSARPRNWLALMPLFAAFCAGFALWCAFKLRHAGLMGAAVAGALLHLVQFYYVLGVSLLMKSLIMIVVGFTLAVAALVFARIKTDAREVA